MLGEDVDWLHELSIDMFSEDGCLRVYGVGEDGVPAFTEYGIECLKQIIADKRAAGGAPPPIRSTKWSCCGVHHFPGAWEIQYCQGGSTENSVGGVRQ